MRSNHKIFGLVGLLMLVSLACSLPLRTATPGALVTPPSVQATSTLAAQSPTLEVLPLPSATATPQPAVKYLSGVLVNPVGGQKLLVYGPDGAQKGQYELPGVGGYVSSSHFLAPGAYTAGGALPPLVYLDTNDKPVLKVIKEGQTKTIENVENLVTLVGAEGQNLLAYVEAVYQNDGVSANLYLGKVESLPLAGPVFSKLSSDSWPMFPLGIKAPDGNLQGVWLSPSAYGIGDVVFAPRRGLYFLEISSGALTQVLGDDRNPVAISADQQWLASVPAGKSTDAGMRALNLSSKQELVYALAGDSDRGAGDAIFTPDGLSLAWMEGGGEIMSETPNFHTRLRVGTGGKVILDLAGDSFSSISGLKKVAWTEPVGWMDATHLLVQVQGETMEETPALVKVQVTDGSMTLFASGSFAGLLYP